MYINNPGHMTKLAAMSIPGIWLKNLHKSTSLERVDLFQQNLARSIRLKYYNKYINHDPVMTLSYFTARST